MRSLKDLGTVNVETFTRKGANNSGLDLKAFQDGMEMKDKELTDLRIKLNSLKTSMKEQGELIDDLRNVNNRLTNEVQVEKQKNSTKVLEKQLNKIKKEVLRKDKDIDE